jgi:hypothetical protein
MRRLAKLLHRLSKTLPNQERMDYGRFYLLALSSSLDRDHWEHWACMPSTKDGDLLAICKCGGWKVVGTTGESQSA